ncbi:MAG: hypothetical protein OEU94_13045 [Aquincola sp.]|nr:hypothetical protein [Aquincola sp.]MDH4287759.1 hypothetical protein [Aquincola sp.]MDH5329882.1 hypothetical protein [Aquincola sp.]
MSTATTVRLCVAMLSGWLSAGVAVAHPGHDSAPAMGLFEALAHVFTQPYHLGLLGLAVGIGAISVRAVRARRQPRAGRR